MWGQASIVHQQLMTMYILPVTTEMYITVFISKATKLYSILNLFFYLFIFINMKKFNPFSFWNIYGENLSSVKKVNTHISHQQAMALGEQSLPSCWARYWTLEVFPVPVSPTNRTGSFSFTAMATRSNRADACLVKEKVLLDLQQIKQLS